MAGWEFLSHATCLNLIVGLGVSLTRPTLESVWSLVVSGVSVTRPILKSVSSFSYRPRDGISHVVRWVGSLFYKPHSKICLVIRRVGSFSYTTRTGICLVIRRVGSLSYTPCAGNCLAVWRVGSLFYMPCDGIWMFVRRMVVSLTSPVLESVKLFVCRDVSVTRPGSGPCNYCTYTVCSSRWVLLNCPRVQCSVHCTCKRIPLISGCTKSGDVRRNV